MKQPLEEMFRSKEKGWHLEFHKLPLGGSKVQRLRGGLPWTSNQ